MSVLAPGPERFALPLPHGIVLECRASGPVAAPRVLLLHGFPEGAFIWDEVSALLCREARCVAPDMRGFGASSSPAGIQAYKARELVRDVAAAIAALGAPLDLLVAHDWGGAVAWALAAQQPGLLRRLLIVNAPHPATFLRELRASRAQQEASAYMNFLCRADAGRLLAENGHARLLRLFGGAPWLTPALRERYLAHWSAGLEGALNYYRASPLRPPLADGTDRLARIDLPDGAVTVRVPTTLLWGLDDTALLPGLTDGLDRWVPDLRLVRVSGASHWIVHERPELVVEEIERALSA